MQAGSGPCKEKLWLGEDLQTQCGKAVWNPPNRSPSWGKIYKPNAAGGEGRGGEGRGGEGRGGEGRGGGEGREGRGGEGRGGEGRGGEGRGGEGGGPAQDRLMLMMLVSGWGQVAYARRVAGRFGGLREGPGSGHDAQFSRVQHGYGQNPAQARLMLMMLAFRVHRGYGQNPSAGFRRARTCRGH